jgi:hypothetical protein
VRLIRLLIYRNWLLYDDWRLRRFCLGGGPPIYAICTHARLVQIGRDKTRVLSLMARCGLILELTRPRTADKIETPQLLERSWGVFIRVVGPGASPRKPRWLKGRADTGGR